MLNNLKKLLESEKKNKTIFDIVVYGSFAKGKEIPADIDIIIIFLEGTLRERLEKLQSIKFKIKKLNKNFDLKQILLPELFSSAFFARTGILLEGISLFSGKYFSEKLGFKSYSLYFYDLTNLSHLEKVKFNYILSGRYSEGILSKLEGVRLADGAIKLPLINTYEFEEILKNNKIKYSKKNILEEI